MPVFGTESRRNLDTLDTRLRLICYRIIEFYDFKVTSGWRGQEQQDGLVRAGLSRLRWPDSKHNYHRVEHGRVVPQSKAMDVVPWFPDPPNVRYPGLYLAETQERAEALAHFHILAGIVMATAVGMSSPVRWGGDWDRDWNLRDQSFDDLGHFELIE